MAPSSGDAAVFHAGHHPLSPDVAQPDVASPLAAEDTAQKVQSTAMVKDDFADEAVGTFREEFKAIVQLAAPACLQAASMVALTLINQIFVGHIGAGELAAASIGFTIFNFAYYFLLGVTTGLDTLGSQAYGAGDRPGVLVSAVSSLVVLTLLCIPVSVIFWYGEILAAVLFKQPPDIAQMAGTYCRWLIPGLFPFIWALIAMKAMQVQNRMWAAGWLMFATTMINVGANALLIKGFGFVGACAATSVSRVILLFSVVGYVAWPGRDCISLERQEALQLDSPPPHKRRRQQGAGSSEDDEAASPLLLVADDDGGSWSPPSGKLPGGDSGDSLSAMVASPDEARTKMTLMGIIYAGMTPRLLWSFLKLGLPGGFALALEASSFDITTGMAGYLGTSEVDASSALLSLIAVAFFAFPFGAATAATIRVGNLLGAARPRTARTAGLVAIGIGVFFNTLVAILIIVFRLQIGGFFVSDPEVIGLVGAIAPFAGAYMPLDAVQGTVQGVLRGMGRQLSLVYVGVGGWWGLSVPLQYLLAFQAHLRLPGLWIGILIGGSTVSVVYSIMLFKADFFREARLARERVESMDQADGDAQAHKGATNAAAETAAAAARSAAVGIAAGTPGDGILTPLLTDVDLEAGGEGKVRVRVVPPGVARGVV